MSEVVLQPRFGPGVPENGRTPGANPPDPTHQTICLREREREREREKEREKEREGGRAGAV